MRLSFLLVFLVCCFPFKGSAEASGHKQIATQMLSLRNSLITKDSAALDKLLVTDATYGHSNGLIESKAELIRSVMSGEQDYKNIGPSEMNIRIYGQTGIVTMKMHVSMIYKGKPLELDMHATLTWVKIDKDWKLVARQSVKL